MFAEAFHSMVKGIHITLEEKTSFDNSTPVMGLSAEFSTWKPRLLTNSHHWHCQKRGKEETYAQ
jgi:hypothetical protein